MVIWDLLGLVGMNLAEKHCTPCHAAGVKPLDSVDAKRLLAAIDGWEMEADAKAISCRRTFKNFKQALDFVNRVGLLAEEENHHPDLSFGWGYVTLRLHTHSIGGLHENDFVLAAKINTLGN